MSRCAFILSNLIVGIWTEQEMVETEMLAFEQVWPQGGTGKSYWIWGFAPLPRVNYGCGNKCTDYCAHGSILEEIESWSVSERLLNIFV